MAEFGVEATTVAPIANAVTPKRGVQAPSAMEAVSGIFGRAKQLFEGAQAGKANQAVSDFEQLQLSEAAAVDQGLRSSSAARSRTRLNLMQALNDNPGARDELWQAHTRVLGTTGAGKIIDTGSQEEREFETRKSALISAGLIGLNATEDEVVEANQFFVQSTAATERFQIQKRTLEMQAQAQKIDAAEAKRQLAELEQSYFTELQPAKVQILTTQFNSLFGQGLSAADNLTSINGMEAAFMEEVSAIGSSLTSQQSGFFMKPFELLFDNARRRATGEISDQERIRRNERTMEGLKEIALSNPKLARVAMAQQLFPDFVKGQDRFDAWNGVATFLAGNDPASNGSTLPAVTELNSAKEVTAYFNLLSAGSQSDDPEAVTSAFGQLNKVLESIADSEGAIGRDPESVIAMVEFLGSPSFLKMSANTDLSVNMQAAREVLGRQYENEVFGMVKSEFTNRQVVYLDPAKFLEGGGQRTSQKPVSGMVEARGAPEGVRFFAIDPSDTTSRQQAERLNGKLASIINTTVRAAAHMQGSSNYQQEFESLAEQYLGGGAVSGGVGEDDLAGGEGDDDLELGDFVFPSIQSDALPEEVADDIQFLSATEELAAKYEIGPEVLMAVMDFETGGTFSPAQKNAAGSGATGLIQFLTTTAKNLGTTTEALSKMSRLEQLGFVEKYLDQFKGKITGGDASDVYMAVLFPRAIDKPDSYVLFTSGTRAYRQNKGLDLNGDGTITKAEAAREVVSRVGKYAT